MSQIFHRSANTIARVSIFGAVFFIAGLLGLFAKICEWQFMQVLVGGMPANAESSTAVWQ